MSQHELMEPSNMRKSYETMRQIDVDCSKYFADKNESLLQCEMCLKCVLLLSHDIGSGATSYK